MAAGRAGKEGAMREKSYYLRATRGFALPRLEDFWNYRELLQFLIWRDVKVRYKQSAIGIAWAILQPLSMMLVFTIFFGRLAGIPSEGIPYPLFAYAALLPWQLFSRAILESTNSLVVDQRLITRVYFPRIVVPTASVLSAIVDFLVASVLLVGLMLFYQVPLTWTMLYMPLFLAIMLVTALGVGYWLSALNLEYRDVMYAVPFLNQLWFFLTPIVYPSSLVPDRWQWLYGLNPMVSVIEGFRWSLLGQGPAPSAMVWISFGMGLVLFVSGAAWFRWRERTFVDAVGSGGR
jgi:lipopolysaccharide transport system permease protein